MPNYESTLVYPSGHEDFVDYGAEIGAMNIRNEAAAAEAFLPVQETDTFSEEIKHTHLFFDDPMGITYGLYHVNQDKQGIPLVMNMSWSVPVGGKSGRSEVKAYAARYDGPVIVIDMEGHGESGVLHRDEHKDINFDDIADAHIRILDRFGIGEFNLQGMSLGGVVAAKMAQHARERVEDLATVSTVSFEKRNLALFYLQFALQEGLQQAQYGKKAPKVVKQEVDTGFVGSVRSIPTLIKLAAMMTQDVVTEAIRGLHPSTNWHDFVGSKERVTNFQSHLAAVRARNVERRLRGRSRNSSVFVIGSESHAYTSLYLNEVARLVTLSLQS
jgi:pimeloyl-ACP methyl ester carboxylesterase